MTSLKKFILTASLSILAQVADAKSKEELVIDYMLEAYGGKALTELKSLTITDKYQGFRYGQSHTPDEVNIAPYHSTVYVDFTKQKKSLLWVRGNKDGYSTQHQIFDGQRGFAIDHDAKTYNESTNLTFNSVDRRHLFYLDTALVYLANQHRQNVTYKEDAEYQGQPHYVLELDLKGYPKMALYVDKESHRLSQMRRPHWREGEFYGYHYDDYQTQDKILFANSNYVTRSGDPYNVTVLRQVEFNSNVDGKFTLPESYKVKSPGLDFSQMKTEKLGEDLYLSGKNWGFSLFYDAGDYFVAAGGYSGLTERFKAVQAFSNTQKPLKYQIVSHHHLDHLGGMKEAYDLGAQFVTVEANKGIIKELVGHDIPESRFVTVENLGAVAQGAVQVLDFPNGHAAHNLVTFFAKGQILFTADMYYSRAVAGAPDGYEGLHKLKKAVTDAGFRPKVFAAAHSGRTLTSEDFEQSLSQISEPMCPPGWQICP